MKKVLALIVCFVFIPVVSAKEETPDITEFLQRHSWEVGPEVYSFKYEESDYMDETGYFLGLSGAYTYREWVPVFPEDRPAIKWMFRAEARYAWGTVDYDGSLSDGTPYTIDDISDCSAEYWLLLGMDFLKETLLDTIYTGIGYRYLGDFASSDIAGYDRKSKYLYLPVGVETSRCLTLDWLFTATLEFDVFLHCAEKLFAELWFWNCPH